MKTQFKFILRRPLVFILLIFLLGVVSFAFTARTVEYLAVNREVEELSAYYRAIGYLTTSNEDGDVAAGAQFLADSDMVAIHDVRRFCAGTMEGIYNTDLNGVIDSLADLELPGTDNDIAEVMLRGELVYKDHFMPEGKSFRKERYTLAFSVEERLYGYPEYARENGSVQLYYYPDGTEDWEDTYESLTEGQSYYVKAYQSYDQGHLVLLRAAPDGGWFMDGDDPRAELTAADVVQEQNRHTAILYGTKDMSAIPDAQEATREMYIVDGRWLNQEDNESFNPVCAVHEAFAERRDLKVGDVLTITIRDVQQPYGYFPRGTTLDEVNAVPGTTQTFTIAGIYNTRSYGQAPISSRTTTIYVPDSCIPAGYDRSVEDSLYGSSYSFVLNHPGDERAFQQQYRGALDALGISVAFVANGWEPFAAAAQPIRQSTAVGAVMFAVVHVLTLLLAVFLYLRQHRKEYAIARALGIPVKRLAGWHLVPLLTLGTIGFTVGTAAAWRYAMEQAQQNLTTLVDIASKGEAAAELPAWYALALWGLSLLLLMLLGGIGLALLARRPVLDVLRDGQDQRAETAAPAAEVAAIAAPHLAPQVSAAVISAQQDDAPRKGGVFYKVEFMLLQLWRRRAKSVLVVLVAVAFTVTLGWIQHSINRTEESINQLYANTRIDVEILMGGVGYSSTELGFVPEIAVNEILDTGYIGSSRLVAADTAVHFEVDARENSLTMGEFPLCGVTDLETLRAPETGGQGVEMSDGVLFDPSAVTFAPGWDETFLATEYKTRGQSLSPTPGVILPENLMEQFHLELGDRIYLGDSSGGFSGIVVAGSYSGSLSAATNIQRDGIIIMPLSLMKLFTHGADLCFSRAEFTVDPARNREVNQFRSLADEIAAEYSGRTPLTCVIWDEELRSVVTPMEQNLVLMRVLYPVTLLVSLLISAALAFLLLLQEAKTAAILRVLGIPVRSVRWIFGAGQLGLCLLGLLCGGVCALALGRWNIGLALCAVFYLVGGLIGSAAGAVAVTRRSALELLQVKE